MAFALISESAVQLGKMPRVCMCCGKRAEQMVEHRFYYDPVHMMLLRLVIPGRLYRLLFARRSVEMMVPVCNGHKRRFKLQTYVAFGLLGVALLFVPLLILLNYAGQNTLQAIGAAVLFVLVIGLLGTMLVLRLISPRLVEMRAGSFGFTGVAKEFSGAFGGTTGPTASAPAISSKQVLLTLGIGGGVFALLIVGVITVGLLASWSNRRKSDAFFADAQKSAKQSHNQFMEESKQRHNEMQRMAQLTPEQHQAEMKRKFDEQRLAHLPPGARLNPPSSNTSSNTSVVPPPASNNVVPPPATSTNNAPPASTTITPPPVLKYADPPAGNGSRAVRGQRRTSMFATDFGKEVLPPMSVKLPPGTQLPAAEEVWALWGNSWYPATVVSMAADGVMVHYQDFGSGSDEVKPWEELAIDTAILAEVIRPAPPAVASSPPNKTPSAPAVTEQTEREWSDATGRFRITGKLAKFADGKVTLLKPDGKEVTVPLARLSAADQAFVNQSAAP